MRSRVIFLAKLSCRAEIGYSTIAPKGILGLLGLGMVLRIAFHKEFSHLPGSLGHLADSNSIPQNHLTIFHSSPIATIQQTFLFFTLRAAL